MLERKHPKDDQILFIFGPARGGTTFLGKLMGDWFDYGTGPEGQFVQSYLKKAARFGDLSKLENRRRLAEELAGVPMLEIVRKRWPKELQFNVTADDILARMSENSMSWSHLWRFSFDG